MDQESEKITLRALVDRLSMASIAEAYEWLAYDYSKEIVAGQTKKYSEPDRVRFISLLAWRSAPTSEMLRRLFNQINTFYAENWMLVRPELPANTVLTELNRLSLFRQGKHVGLRFRPVAFGYRVHLEFGDAFRPYKWLYGIGPQFLKRAVDDWCATIEECPRTFDMAIALAITLIAIHPFADANGRVGRLIFTWLCQRWKLNTLWLGEAADGELRRTGHGINSTEYLMAMFMIKLAGEQIVVEPGTDQQSSDKEAQLYKSMSEGLTSMRTNHPRILATSEFEELKTHLWSEQHFRETSPRFECVQGALT